MSCSGSFSVRKPSQSVSTLRDVISGNFVSCFRVFLPAVKTSRGAGWRVEPCRLIYRLQPLLQFHSAPPELSPSLNMLYGLLGHAPFLFPRVISEVRRRPQQHHHRPLIKTSRRTNPPTPTSSAPPKLSAISPELLFPLSAEARALNVLKRLR